MVFSSIEILTLLFLVLTDLSAKVILISKSNDASYNTGIAFSIGRDEVDSTTLIVLTTIFLSFILFSLLRIKGRIVRGLVYLFIGGLINLIDRIFVGKVVDYLSFFSLLHFNLADILIVIGLLLIVHDFIRSRNIHKKNVSYVKLD